MHEGRAIDLNQTVKSCRALYAKLSKDFLFAFTGKIPHLFRLATHLIGNKLKVEYTLYATTMHSSNRLFFLKRIEKLIHTHARRKIKNFFLSTYTN